jgi:hypothetical protein
MKWLFLNVIVFSLLGFFFPQVVCADSGKPVVIKSITHSRESEAKEVISFKFAGPLVPEIFSLQGENPRLVLDFPQSIYWGKNIIKLTDSDLASAIRIGLHQTPVQKTRIVVDLSKKSKVQYSSEYSEQENTLLVILTSDAAVEVQTAIGSDLQLQKQNVPSGQDDLSKISQDEKQLSPAVPEKVETDVGEPAGETIAAPLVPMIYEISFDDSSGKGEMVLFHLNDFYPPVVSTIEKDSPRVVCDFMAMNLSPDIQKTILTKGKYIERIRTVKYQDPDKIQVVVELFPDQDYDLQQVFFKKEKLFVLIVKELIPKQDIQDIH